MKTDPSSVDPDGLLEYSVVFTDRSLNGMSKKFQGVMNDIHAMLTEVYSAESAVIVPGGGSFAMEAVARQFAQDKNCLVLRNGWFSYRWTQIFEAGNIPSSAHVVKARRTSGEHQAAFSPRPVEEIVAKIETVKPDVLFAPHVETSAGIMLPDTYIKQVADAVHANGGLFVLDCVASGCIWIDMAALGVDVLISAPQKGWSSSPSSGLVMLSDRAVAAMEQSESDSFALNLKTWHNIMKAYLGGGHAYHATMPTDALASFRDTMVETRTFGFDAACKAQAELGIRIRQMLSTYGYRSVAAPGFEAASVVVSYTDDPAIHNGSAFAVEGIQIAAGVPLRCDEPDDYRTFRIGLFGLDKLANIDRTVDRFEAVLKRLGTSARDAAE